MLKCAPEMRIQREKEILQQFEGHSCLRSFIDYGKEPSPFLALEYLELDALKASGQAKLERQDIKFIARSVLSALESLHAKGIAHTGRSTVNLAFFALLARYNKTVAESLCLPDIKPDNILLNFDAKSSRVVEAKLADCGKLGQLIELIAAVASIRR